MGIVKIGGSIGNGVLLMVAAWAAHVFTRRVQGSSKPAAESKAKQLRTRFFTMLAESSFKLLATTGAIPFVVLDLRGTGDARPPDFGRFRRVGSGAGPAPDAAQAQSGADSVATANGQSQSSTLAASEADAAGTAWHCISPAAAATALRDPATWRSAFPDGQPYPTSADLIVLVTWSKDNATRVATAAEASRINNPRCVHVMPPGRSHATPNPILITRDAVSHLMHLRGLSTIPQNPFLLDVRRRDEVTLFGSIPEAKHVPLLDLIFALAAPSEHEFEDVAGFERPERGQLLVFCSRVRKRAELAACIALDHGYERVYVCKGGTNGWGVDGGVLPYAAFGAHEAPPPAGRRRGNRVDIDEAAAELRRLGIL